LAAMASLAASPAETLRTAMTTCTPRRASTRAVSRPRPLDAPARIGSKLAQPHGFSAMQKAKISNSGGPASQGGSGRLFDRRHPRRPPALGCFPAAPRLWSVGRHGSSDRDSGRRMTREPAECNSSIVTEAKRKYEPVMMATRPRPSTPAVTSSAVEAPEKPEGPLR
jgi:hypothetical protein